MICAARTKKRVRRGLAIAAGVSLLGALSVAIPTTSSADSITPHGIPSAAWGQLTTAPGGFIDVQIAGAHPVAGDCFFMANPASEGAGNSSTTFSLDPITKSGGGRVGPLPNGTYSILLGCENAGNMLRSDSSQALVMVTLDGAPTVSEKPIIAPQNPPDSGPQTRTQRLPGCNENFSSGPDANLAGEIINGATVDVDAAFYLRCIVNDFDASGPTPEWAARTSQNLCLLQKSATPADQIDAAIEEVVSRTGWDFLYQFGRFTPETRAHWDATCS